MIFSENLVHKSFSNVSLNFKIYLLALGKGGLLVFASFLLDISYLQSVYLDAYHVFMCFILAFLKCMVELPHRALQPIQPEWHPNWKLNCTLLSESKLYNFGNFSWFNFEEVYGLFIFCFKTQIFMISSMEFVYSDIVLLVHVHTNMCLYLLKIFLKIDKGYNVGESNLYFSVHS